MARIRGASAQQSSAPEVARPRRALREKTNTARTATIGKDLSDDNEHATSQPEKKKSVQRQPKDKQVQGENIMSGGPKRSTKNLTRDRVTDSFEETSVERPMALQTKSRKPTARVQKKTVARKTQRKGVEGSQGGMVAASTAMEEALEEQTVHVAISRKTSSRDDDARRSRASNVSSEEAEQVALPVSRSPTPDRTISLKRKRSSPEPIQAAEAPQPTPAVESSMLALKNFKRRPRQHSILQMVQQRLASAQASMISVNADDSVDDIDLDLDLDLERSFDDDEDDFAPDAEGTPLHKSRIGFSSRPSFGTTAPRRQSSAKKLKRQSQQMEDLVPITGRTLRSSMSAQGLDRVIRSRDTVHVIAVPSSAPASSEQASSPQQPDPLPEEFLVPSTEEAQHEDDCVSSPHINAHTGIEDDAASTGTMADPIGSSSPTKRSPGASQADILADPATQVTPEPRRPTRGRKPAKPLSSAALQTLLPKRRRPLRQRQRKSEFDALSDSDHDETEISEQIESFDDADGCYSEIVVAPRLQSRLTTPSGGKAKTPARVRSTAKVASSALRSAAPSMRRSEARTRSHHKRTYGRGATSDKENDSSFEEADESTLPDISISMEEAVQCPELEKAKQKFADVDDWDMEFESVEDEHRDSSQSWR